MPYLVHHPYGLGDSTPQQRLFGLRADAAIRVGLPIVGGLMTTTGLVLGTLGGQMRWAVALAVSGALLTALASMGEIIASEQAAGTLR